MARTLLAIGAHYDDCVFGIPGTLLRAVRKHYRVVNLALIGDYSNWEPARGRAREIVEGTASLARDHGAQMQFLTFKSQHFDVDLETKKAVARAVAEVKPDIAFLLWPHDRHPDHEAASRLSNIAFRQASRLVESPQFRPPRRIYYYDNGPGHTVGVEPDTYVDITPEWDAAIDWLGKLMALVRNETYQPGSRDGAQQTKEALALYRGKACGVKYAEAVRSANAYPSDPLEF